MRAYRFIDRNYAADAERGVILVGTLRGFANLEGIGRDEQEGTATRVLDKFYVPGGTLEQHDREMLRSMGIHAGNVTLDIENLRFVVTHPNVYCMCFTDSPMHSTFAKLPGKAGFMIKGVHSLAKQICEENRELVAGYRVGRVRYKEIEVDARRVQSVQPTPFEKALEFSEESEIRIAFQPCCEGDIEPFVTKPSLAISRLLERI